MSASAEQQCINDMPKTLIEWAKKYFEENEEVLKLFKIYSPDDLQRRILDISKLYADNESRQQNHLQKGLACAQNLRERRK